MTAGTGIYAIENSKTGACYVGGTRRGFLPRWIAHRARLLLGRHYNIALQEDWNALGAGWFKFVVLEEIKPAEMSAGDEQRWLDELRGQSRLCYNRGPVFSYPLFIEPNCPAGHMTAAQIARVIGLPNPNIPGLPDDEPVLTVETVANYFAVSKLTVVRLLSTGTLAGFRVGREWRITKHAVATFMQHQRIHQSAPEATSP